MSSIKILKILEVLQVWGLLLATGRLDLLAEEIEKELSLSTRANAKNLGKFKGFTTGER